MEGNATYCIKWAKLGPPLNGATAWHRVGTEADTCLDVLCRQSRCPMPQISQELSSCVQSTNKVKCSNIVGGDATMPQTAFRNTEVELVFFTLACVQ